MSKHTPGPLTINDKYDDGATRYYPVLMCGEAWVAETTEDYAHLFAAAPQLLEALKAIVECFKPENRTQEDLLRDGAAAIRKAEEGEG